jgi:hypothetical protein
LVPASPWLEDGAPAAPTVQFSTRSGGMVELTLGIPNGSKPVQRWAVWQRYGARWIFSVVHQPTFTLALFQPGDAATPLDGLVVSALDRVGNESPRVGVRLANRGVA